MPTRPAAPQKAEDSEVDAGECEHCDPHRDEDHGASKIGLLHQQEGDRAGQHRRHRKDGQRLVAVLQAQQPGHRDDEERLEEFRRLDLAEAEVDPASGAVHLGAEDRNKDQEHQEKGRAAQAQPARAILGHHRNADHHRHAERDPGELAPEVIELGEMDVAARIALAGGGRGGGHGDQADGDQHGHQQQQDLVDLPEPAAHRAGVRAAVAFRVDQRRLGLDLARDALDHNSPTKARNWSPRSSKSLNWSKLAQAGDSSTVSPGAASAAASRTATSSFPQFFTGM